MGKVIVYDEMCEILNIESILKTDFEIVGYLKDNNEYFGEFINGIKVYTLSNFEKDIEGVEFDYIIVNSRNSFNFYEKIKECGIYPGKILDICFLNYNSTEKNFKEKLLCCKENSSLDFDIIFLGRGLIDDQYISLYFNDYMNISNDFLDIHYDYHLIYYLVKNNKIKENTKIGIFINYQMIYENIDLSFNKNYFKKIFEEIFSVHNNEKFNNTYFDFCYENFKTNFKKIFDIDKLECLDYVKNFDISKDEIKKIKYDSRLETISYKQANVVAFKMNKNIISQTIKLLYENNIKVFFIIPPVYKEYRSYINNFLRKEFYMLLNKNLNEKLFIFDYFEINFSEKYFYSPTSLNHNGILEFLKLLSHDVKNKFSCDKICNDL